MIAICIGHSRSGDSGAVSTGNVTEHTFNTDIGNRLEQFLDYPVELITHYEGSGYTTAQKWLGEYLKLKKATLAIELHFNSADTQKAQGFEYLHHQNSRRGEDLARCLIDAHRPRFAGALSRGLQPIGPSGRGFEFLHRTPCPAVICEPFFGSNPGEWALYSSEHGRQTLAESYAAGIKQFLGL